MTSQPTNKRNLQKQRTREALKSALLAQLAAHKSFASISLREVARGAGVAPTSFYRHFPDLETLGLELIDEAGLTLRQLMRKARQRVEAEGGIVETSVDVFFRYVFRNPSLFRLLLKERHGDAPRFRVAINAEIDHFVAELTADLLRLGKETDRPLWEAEFAAEAIVTLVFNHAQTALESPPRELSSLKNRVIGQLRIILAGSRYLYRKEAAEKSGKR